MTEAENLLWLQELVRDEAPESSTLEFKGAAALRKDDTVRREMTKDASAMANSAGGVIIYGIKEKRRHNVPCAHSFDPIDGEQFRPEWLDQRFSLIMPRIPNLSIEAVVLDQAPPNIIYIVRVTMGETAHQALDRIYHRRRNTTTGAMEDFEVREVMNRRRYPKVSTKAEFLLKGPYLKLTCRVSNCGLLMIKHLKVLVQYPEMYQGNFLFLQTPVEHGKFSRSKDPAKLRAGCLSFTNNEIGPFFPGYGFEFAANLLLDRARSVQEPITEQILVTTWADDMPVEREVRDAADWK